MDFELTDDGDLYLGDQKVDEEGYLLYYKTDRMGYNLPIETRDVDEASIPIRDFSTIHQDEESLQLIKTKLKTDNPDWIMYTNVGASLTDFIGRHNNYKTGKEIESRILNTLIRDGSFNKEELKINLIPTSSNEVLIDIKFDKKSLYSRYAIILNFEIGIKNVYLLDKEGKKIELKEKINPGTMEGMARIDSIDRAQRGGV